MPKAKAAKRAAAKVQPARPAADRRQKHTKRTTTAPGDAVHRAALAERPADVPRRLRLPRRVWYKPLTWRHRPPVPAYAPLPKGRRLFFGTVRRQLWQHRLVFGGIALVYGVLNLLLVRGFSGSSNLSDLKSLLDSLATGFGSKLLSALGSFAYLLSTSGSGNTQNSGVYQMLLLIVCSLAFIWTLRQVTADHRVRIRDGFYHGMTPFVTFTLVFLLLALQLMPLLAGSGLYGLVVSSGIVVYAWEKALFLAIFVVLALWSLRMITATLFAVYVVTLPDMTPLRAYRSARQLVYGRRLLIWRKLVFLLVILLLIAAVIELPLILFVTPLAEWVFFVLSMLALPVVHSYLYNLYRAML